MRRFSILVVFLAVFFLLFGEEVKMEAKLDFYKKQYSDLMKKREFLLAYDVLNKMKENIKSEDFSAQEKSLEDSILLEAKNFQEDYNADKAVEYLKFYTRNFSEKKVAVYNWLSQIFLQAGEQEKADFYMGIAKELE